MAEIILRTRNSKRHAAVLATALRAIGHIRTYTCTRQDGGKTVTSKAVSTATRPAHLPLHSYCTVTSFTTPAHNSPCQTKPRTKIGLTLAGVRDAVRAPPLAGCLTSLVRFWVTVVPFLSVPFLPSAHNTDFIDNLSALILILHRKSLPPICIRVYHCTTSPGATTASCASPTKSLAGLS